MDFVAMVIIIAIVIGTMAVLAVVILTIVIFVEGI